MLRLAVLRVYMLIDRAIRVELEEDFSEELDARIQSAMKPMSPTMRRILAKGQSYATVSTSRSEFPSFKSYNVTVTASFLVSTFASSPNPASLK